MADTYKNLECLHYAGVLVSFCALCWNADRFGNEGDHATDMWLTETLNLLCAGEFQ